jgi:hypothetical protein
MPRATLLACLPFALLACGEPEGKRNDTAESASPSLDGDYAGTLSLGIIGGGGEGSCEAPLTVTLLTGGSPEASGTACCAVEGLTTHGDVDICVLLVGALDADRALAGDVIAHEQGGAAGEPNGSWAGSFEADGALVGRGSGTMEHDMGSTSFELLYDLDLALQPE